MSWKIYFSIIRCPNKYAPEYFYFSIRTELKKFENILKIKQILNLLNEKKMLKEN